MLKIYAIPGWGFQSNILNTLNNDTFYLAGLDYVHLSEFSLTEIARRLSTSLEDQAVLLGWSFGGLIAIKLAAMFPKKVKRLVLLDTQPKLIASINWTGISHDLAHNFKKALAQDFKKQMDWFIRLACYPNRSQVLRELLKQNLFQNAEQELTSLLSILFAVDLRDEYRNLNCDVLHICCEQDVVTPQNIIQLTSLNKRITTRVFSGMGHIGFLLKRATYVETIKDFLNVN